MLGRIKRVLNGTLGREAFENRKSGGGRRLGGVTPPPEGPSPGPQPQVPMVREIVVPRSAIEAWPETADPLVGAVVDYVNYLINQAKYKRTEINPAAMQAFHSDYYLAQVLNGGHAQFVGNASAFLEATIVDVLSGLRAMQQKEYFLLASSMNKWVAENPDEAAQQTGFAGGIAPALAALDTPFYKLNRKQPLRREIAAWLVAHPDLKVVPDADVPAELARIAEVNTDAPRRRAVIECATIAGQLADPLRIGVSMACARIDPMDFFQSLTAGSYREIEGAQRMAIGVRTFGGLRYAVPVEGQGVLIYECIQHDNSHLPKNKFDATLDDIQRFKPDEVGSCIARAEQDEILAAIDQAKRLEAGAAIHLLVSRQSLLMDVPALTLNFFGNAASGGEAMTFASIVGDQVLLFVIRGDMALLRDTKTKEDLAIASRAEVTFHARSHAIETLI
ncbi:DMP19 family protein [Primorskyibacter sp. 2E233]|uniref:DMP19 family protein n=1 Tax=Primorskyibacter sp. 2E233 TaxID=3413431 RepID=UPI003BF172FD